MFLFNNFRLRHLILPTKNKEMELVTDFAFILSCVLFVFLSRKTVHALEPVKRILVTAGNYVRYEMG